LEKQLIFACARVRSQENYMITRDKLTLMTEARSMEDACKVLQDAGYGSENEILVPQNYEKILVTETVKLFSLLASIAKGRRELLIFAYPYDYHNIKVLLKAEILGLDYGSILMTGGTVEPALMTAYVRERNYQAMTANMKLGIEEALDTHARTKDPQCIDLILDRCCYRDICDIAAQSGNEFLQGYVRLLIDTINLKTFARVRRIGEPWTYFSSVFIPGGSIEDSTFISGYEESLTQFPQRLSSSLLAEAADTGFASIKESGSFTELERLCDNAMIRYISRAKFITYGIEPLIAYTAAKQMEIKSVRIILAGKTAGLEPSRIRERLRETYG